MKSSRLLISYCLAVLSCVAQGVEVPDYFPEVEGDLSLVTWAHAVNNQAFLQESIAGDVMMLEADVVLGRLVQGGNEILPVMAHPPAVVSDLSLRMFLEQVVNATEGGKRKGTKLDFKSIDVLDQALTELEMVQSRITFPVWLNADIVSGPVNNTALPVNGEEFLSQCKTRFPTSTLSPGWKTRYGYTNGVNITEGTYTAQHINDMTTMIAQAQISQPVTFPVRAGLTAHSLPEVEALLSAHPNSTLTLWSSENDVVDVAAMRDVLDQVGRHRVYIDVPEDLREALKNSATAIVVPSLALLSSLAILP